MSRITAMVYDPDTAGSALTVACWLLSKEPDEHYQAMELIRSLDDSGAVLSFVEKFMSGGAAHRDCLIRIFAIYGEQVSPSLFGLPQGWWTKSSAALRAHTARSIRYQTGIPITGAELAARSRKITTYSSHGPARRERLAHVLAAWLCLNLTEMAPGEPFPGDSSNQLQLFRGAQ